MSNVIKFDMSRRSRRNALRADQAAAVHTFETYRQILESQLVERAHRSLADVLADGLPSQSMGEPGGSNGGHGDPTASAVLSNERRQQLSDDIAKMLERLAADSTHLFRLLSTAASLTVPPAEADAAGAGSCARCDEWVPGSASSRIKSGLCPRCYTAWRRAGMPDRSEFNRTTDEDDVTGA
jgi:hypothetical protein